MRVELKLETLPHAVASEIPWSDTPGASGGEGARFLDLRETPRLVDRIAAAREFPPLRTFLTAMNERDSFFYTARCKTSRMNQPEDLSKVADGASHPSSSPTANGAIEGSPQGIHSFSTRVDLAFAREALNASRIEWAQAAGQLEELLMREPGGETLTLELTLRKCTYGASHLDGFLMQMGLRAWAASAELAQVRCGLGLARVQQALLFISRGLRQRLGETQAGADL